MTVLADTSAWVEYLRATGSSTDHALEAAIGTQDVITCDPVVLEILAGARDDAEERLYESLLAGARRHEPTMSFHDPVSAAALHRTCRRSGETVRSMLDCQIAAIAIRLGVPVLHRDRDFDVLARHTALEVTT
jgi:predicted nucleic acid-binding protein